MDKLKDGLHIAIVNLLANKTRSFLSILGVVIGIASVVTILAMTAGARADVIKKVNALGLSLYQVFSEYDEKSFRSGELDFQDIQNLKQLHFVVTAFPKLNFFKEIRSRHKTLMGNIVGIDPSYFKAKNLTVVEGRNVSPVEIERRATVCLVSRKLAETFFPESDPLGQSLFFSGNRWDIIGLYNQEEARRTRNKRSTQEMEILVPLETLLRTEKEVDFQSLEVHVNPDFKGNVKEEMLAVMEGQDPKRKGLYSVWDQQEYIQKRLEIDRILSLIMTIVASISLLVGGIGMMNVMLTSVAERTREIGIRRAVGARKKDILIQFLIESSVLSGIGGFLGIFLGASTARALPVLFHKVFQVGPQLNPVFALISMVSAVLMGGIFGLYPAIKASRLSAAEALRSE